MQDLTKLLVAVFVSFGFVGCGDPLNTVVSEHNNEVVRGNVLWMERVTNPLSFLSNDEKDEFSKAIHGLWIVQNFQHFQPWTEEGLGNWCRSTYLGGWKEFEVVEGTTYRELLHVSEEHEESIADVRDLYLYQCLKASDFIRHSRMYPVTASAPHEVDGSKYGISGTSVELPPISVWNYSKSTINKIEVLWEVGINGRDSLLARNRAKQEISGGLMEGESVSLERTGWSAKNTRDFLSATHRLGDVQIEIRACVQAINGTDLYGSRSCLDAGIDAYLLIKKVINIAPHVTEILEEPIFVLFRT